MKFMAGMFVGMVLSAIVFVAMGVIAAAGAAERSRRRAMHEKAKGGTLFWMESDRKSDRLTDYDHSHN